uniref:Uncharacterized protein n=1 Tax=Arundo donax TaxID=35708 RepID=A0A0A9CGF0_ARUDO
MNSSFRLQHPPWKPLKVEQAGYQRLIKHGNTFFSKLGFSSLDRRRPSLATGAAEEVVERRAAARSGVHLGRRPICEEVAAVLALRPEVVVGLAAPGAGGDVLELVTSRRCRRRHLLRPLLRRWLGRRPSPVTATAAAEEVVQRALPATVAHAPTTTHPLLAAQPLSLC